MELCASVCDFDVRKVGQPHDLGKQLERRSDHGLRRNNGRQYRNNQAKVQASGREGLEEGIRVGSLRLVGGYVRSLPYVSHQETGVHKTEPGYLDGALAERPKIGKKSLDTGEC